MNLTDSNIQAILATPAIVAAYPGLRDLASRLTGAGRKCNCPAERNSSHSQVFDQTRAFIQSMPVEHLDKLKTIMGMKGPLVTYIKTPSGNKKLVL